MSRTAKLPSPHRQWIVTIGDWPVAGTNAVGFGQFDSAVLYLHAYNIQDRDRCRHVRTNKDRFLPVSYGSYFDFLSVRIAALPMY